MNYLLIADVQEIIKKFNIQMTITMKHYGPLITFATTAKI